MSWDGEEHRGSRTARSWNLGGAPRSAGRAVLVLAALTGVVAADAHELFDEAVSAAGIAEAELRHLLLEYEYGTSLSADELLVELERHGRGAVGALHRALEEADGPAAQLPGWRSRELELALRGLPGAVLSRRAGSGGAADIAGTRIALAALEQVGTAAELTVLIELVEPRGAGGRLERPVARDLESALAALVERDGSTCAALERRFADLHPALHAPVVRALGASGRREVLELLGLILGERAELDLSVLAEINRVVSRVGPPHDWSFMLRVRAYLAARDPALRREAALAAGHMEDVEAFSDVLALLEDEHAGVRENAYWALQRMSGRKLPAVPERWDRWHAAELEWWDQEAPAQLAAAGMGSEAERVQALSELSSHRLFRHELARELAWFLVQPEPELARLACSTLGGLRSPVPGPELVALLGHDDADLRRQAWLALRAITGKDLPAEQERWRALFPR